MEWLKLHLTATNNLKVPHFLPVKLRRYIKLVLWLVSRFAFNPLVYLKLQLLWLVVLEYDAPCAP